MPKNDCEPGPNKGEKCMSSVHSFNYKLGEVLKKEIQCLNREEKNTACSMTIDQRIITTRFRNRLSRSVELMKYHDRIRSRFHHEELRGNATDTKKATKLLSLRQNEQDTAEQLDYDSPHNFDGKFCLKKFTDLGASKNRPQTAVEMKSKLWNKRADTAKERVVRAKSAPPSSWRNCEDILMKLNCGRGGFYAANKVTRPLSRAKFHEVFDSESFSKFREMELKKQSHDVKNFIQSIEPLKLVPWCPGPVEKTDENKVTMEIMNERVDYPGFVTRVDSYY